MTIIKYLRVGGVISMGFDSSGEYLLVISHSGRGVFSTKTWERIARDIELAYPEHGHGRGIGPIDGMSIAITEKNYETDELRVTTPDGLSRLEYDGGTITISAIQE